MPIHQFTRRLFGRVCAGALLSRVLQPKAVKAGILTWEVLPSAGTCVERRYHADAQVSLFSIPILRCRGVGDGATTWRESIGDGGQPLRLLEFMGRSTPEHAAGLNRFGFIRELSRAEEESIYFGLMTSSPEESAEQARKALHSTAAEVAYSAIEGRLTAGQIETIGAHFTAPARLFSTDRSALIERAQRALSGVPQRTTAFDRLAGPPRPFLHALADVLNRPGKSETRFIYSGHLYRLRVERSRDPKVTEHFQALRLLAPAAKVARIDGRLRREEGGKESEFRLWVEEGARFPLPLRIDYQPRSYLRLTFEAET